MESGVFGLLADILFRHSRERGNPQGHRVSGDDFGRGCKREFHSKTLASGSPLDSRVRGNDGKAWVTQQGFVLASAIFLLVIMAALAAFIVQVSIASQTASAQDVQGARAYQAARLGIEAGLYSVQIPPGSCPATTTLANIPGLTGFKVTWTCAANGFKDGSADGNNNRTIYEITATACTTSGASCPSTTPAEMQSADYTERQLVVLTER